MRCFVGIPLPDATRAALAGACSAVRAADPDWRGEKRVAAENLHVTLAFLGNVPAETIPLLREAIGGQFTEVRAFDLPFARLRPVPSGPRANMLWAAYEDPDGACTALASAVGRAAAGFDVPPDERAFRAHVTLVRTRRPRRVGERALAALSAAEPTIPAFVSVRSATLFSSTLTKAGPHYEILDSWEFPA